MNITTDLRLRREKVQRRPKPTPRVVDLGIEKATTGVACTAAVDQSSAGLLAKRRTLQIALCTGALVVTLSGHEAAAQETVPVDLYGRPLFDQLGPIDYWQDGDNWIAIHADGSWEPAPPITSDLSSLPSDNSPHTGFHFAPYVTVPSGSVPKAVAIGDVTGDGRPDVLMTTGHYDDPDRDCKLLLLAQTADGNLAPPVRYTFAITADGNGLALADLDEDGLLDAVVGHGLGITVLLADGHGGLHAGAMTLDADAYKVVATDVDRDGHVDIVSLGVRRGATIFYGDGRGGFRQKEPLETYALGPSELKTEDLTGDGVDDLAVMTGNLGAYLTVHPHDGVGAYGPGSAVYSIPLTLFGGVGLGDVTGDGLHDAVLSTTHGSAPWLWLFAQHPTDHGLMDPTPIPTFVGPSAVEVADVDGDGREDVVVNHGSSIRLGVYLQTPSGGLSSEVLYPIPYVSYGSGGRMAIGDVSSDGCVDVVFGTHDAGLVVLHGVGCVPLCQPGLCNDGNPCTDDSCNPATGCVFTNGAAPCDDGNPCTMGDACGGGVCHAGGPTDCDDGSCCTIDSCNPATGCVHAANTTAPVFTTQPTLGDTILWPPNHGYVDFAVSDTGASAASGCGIASIQFASCASSQLENGTGTGDGNSIRDCVYTPAAVHLRAERDGACSPIGRVYTTTIVAVDVCGNVTTSNPFSVNVWHDRAHLPAQGTVRSSTGDTQDVRDGTNGTYGTGCGTGSPNANGTLHDHSDVDPDMEVAQDAAIDVNSLTLVKGTDGAVTLSWIAPQDFAPINVTRYHIYRLDPVSLFWTQLAELPKQITSYQDPILNDGQNRQYKVTAVIK